MSDPLIQLGPFCLYLALAFCVYSGLAAALGALRDRPEWVRSAGRGVLVVCGLLTLAVLGVDDLLRPMVRDLIRKAESNPEGGYRIPSTLQGLADDCGLSMFEAHRALHQLFDSKAIRLVDDCLYAKDLEALSACLEPDQAA